ncbi:hypothetical protein [Saccharicrinis sp. FJH54]|uniref:hypothetical protein n=1 Tax=Saccharicrinis sp. FJH54 TaxID=3344665 RepID=UPI0035D45B75
MMVTIKALKYTFPLLSKRSIMVLNRFFLTKYNPLSNSIIKYPINASILNFPNNFGSENKSQKEETFSNSKADNKK